MESGRLGLNTENLDKFLGVQGLAVPLVDRNADGKPWFNETMVYSGYTGDNVVWVVTETAEDGYMLYFAVNTVPG